MNEWEIIRIADFFNKINQFTGVTQNDDKVWGLGHKSGSFSVRSSYQAINQTNVITEFWPWKHIWKVKTPYKEACFVWLVARKACLTENNLMKRGLPLCSRCHLCGREAETINHLFLHCSVTVQVWNIFLALAGVHWVMPNNTKEMLSCWNKGSSPSAQKNRWDLIPACIWWSIWKERNSRCFETRAAQFRR